MCRHLTVACVAEGLGVSWNIADAAVLPEGKRVLIEDSGRFDGVSGIGVDERVVRHPRRGDKYVTVIIDLTGVRDGTGPTRLLDMVEGRSEQAFKAWLTGRPQAWREAVEVVVMEALFTGDTHVHVEVTGAAYQGMISVYREADKARGRQLVRLVIDSLTSGVPATLSELVKLCRTRARRAEDVLAYFDRPAPPTDPPRP